MNLKPKNEQISQQIIKPIQIKLKSNISPLATNSNEIQNPIDTTGNTVITTTKRTQKAKHKPNTVISSGQIILPNSIDEIIGDMVFQEPTIKLVPHEEKVILEQQVQVLQKQKELLEQLQHGIRPGWFIQCVGRRADGKQCTRNIKKGSEFCMGHSIKTAYGRIDVPILNTLSSQNGKSTITAIPNKSHKPNNEFNTTKSEANTSGHNVLSDSEDEDAIDIPADVKELLDAQPSDALTTTARISSSKKNGKCAKSGPKNKPVANGPATTLTAAIIGDTLSDSAQELPAAPKKRGRRRKLPIDPRFGNNDYIIMWPIICEDQRFLTDRYENIYSNDPAHPVFIGVREVSGQLNRLALPKTS